LEAVKLRRIIGEGNSEKYINMKEHASEKDKELIKGMERDIRKHGGQTTLF